MVREAVSTDANFSKMSLFVGRLFLNPGFLNLPPPEVEGALINFLQQNQKQLAATFASAEYYPGLEWREVQILFFSALKQHTLDKMAPHFTELVDAVDLSFLPRLGGAAGHAFPDELKAFLAEICGNLAVRQAFDTTFKLIQHRWIDKYVDQVCKRHEYVWNMISRKDNLHQLEPQEVAAFFKLALLLRNVVYMKLPVPVQNGTERCNIDDVRDNPKLQRAFLAALEAHLVRRFPDLPELVLRVAIDSNKDCHESVELLAPSALLLAIFAKRGKEYSPWLKADKAAEQPDKSWFRIAVRNHLYHGLDKTMLEECYKIAADSNW